MDIRSGDAEIVIDNLVAAVAGLNCRILRLRDEIVAFKNEDKTPCNSSRWEEVKLSQENEIVFQSEIINFFRKKKTFRRFQADAVEIK